MKKVKGTIEIKIYEGTPMPEMVFKGEIDPNDIMIAKNYIPQLYYGVYLQNKGKEEQKAKKVVEEKKALEPKKEEEPNNIKVPAPSVPVPEIKSLPTQVELNEERILNKLKPLTVVEYNEYIKTLGE